LQWSGFGRERVLTSDESDKEVEIAGIPNRTFNTLVREAAHQDEVAGPQVAQSFGYAGGVEHRAARLGQYNFVCTRLDAPQHLHFDITNCHLDVGES